MVSWHIRAKCSKCGFDEYDGTEGGYYWAGVVAKEYIDEQKKRLRERHKTRGCDRHLKYELIAFY